MRFRVLVVLYSTYIYTNTVSRTELSVTSMCQDIFTITFGSVLYALLLNFDSFLVRRHLEAGPGMNTHGPTIVFQNQLYVVLQTQ